jgi:hypothetical protein
VTPRDWNDPQDQNAAAPDARAPNGAAEVAAGDKPPARETRAAGAIGARTRGRRAALGEVLDAYGRRVRVVDPAGDWLLGRHETVEMATLDRVMRELDRTHATSLRTLRIGIAAVTVLLVASVALVAISIAVEGAAAFADLRASLLFTGPAIAMMVGAGVVAPVLVARQRRLAGARDAWLRHGHCPACAYRIAEVTAVAGVRTCPECGAAWNDGAARSDAPA